MRTSFRMIWRGVRLILAFPFFVSCSYTFYQGSCDYRLPSSLKKLAELSMDIRETSGLEKGGSGFVTFNDSGGEPAIYSLDQHGNLMHKTIITNALNVDWEDITADSAYYYVADVGNNFGKRDTLCIYRVARELVGRPDSLAEYASRISFTYADPVSRDAFGRYSHDCEALVAYRDSLYLFTKNWLDRSTSVYVLPVLPGHHHVYPRRTYQVDALITGADLYLPEKEMVLLGYRNSMPVMVLYRFGESPADIECGGKVRKYPFRFSRQTEGVCFDENGRILVTAERRVHPPAMFHAY